MAAGRGKEAVERRKNTEGGGGRRVAWAGLCELKKKNKEMKEKKEMGRIEPSKER